MQVPPPLASCASACAVASRWTLYQKVPLLQPFPRLLFSSVNDSGAWGTYGDVTFHPVETIEGSYCHTVETVLPRGFVNPQMCSRIVCKIQNRNTSLIRAFHSFEKHELLCARF